MTRHSKVIKKIHRAELAYLKLREAIIEQAMAPGMKLPEDVIGGHFGISRTLVRTALVKLQNEGLVDIRTNKGAAVAHPSIEEAREVFAVRHTLERQAVPLVIAHWSAQIEAALSEHVGLEAAAVAKESPVSIRLAGEFHIKLAEYSGNGLLKRYITELVSRSSLILALYGRPHSSECAVNEHKELIDAFRSGNKERAIDLMTHHLGAVEERALLKSGLLDPPALEQILRERFPSLRP
jgi:DNA-binding GntR family transcriptional regulator